MFYLRSNALLAMAAAAAAVEAANQLGTYQYQCVFGVRIIPPPDDRSNVSTNNKQTYPPDNHNLSYSFEPRADHAVYSTPIHKGSAIALDHCQIQIPVGPLNVALGNHYVFENVTELDFILSGATPTPLNVANLKGEAGTVGGSYHNISAYVNDNSGAVSGPVVYAGPLHVNSNHNAVIRLGEIKGTSKSTEVEADGSVGPTLVQGNFSCSPLPSQTLFTFSVKS